MDINIFKTPWICEFSNY